MEGRLAILVVVALADQDPEPDLQLPKLDIDKSKTSERFELFVCGKEIANAYTELNDPEVQRWSVLHHLLRISQMRILGRGDYFI